MNPEEPAKQNMDGQLTQAGWRVQEHARMNLYAGRSVVRREVEAAVEAGLKRAAELRRVSPPGEAVLRGSV